MPRNIHPASPQERKVIKECAVEGFWRRSLPLSLGAGVGTYYLVRTGKLRPNKIGAIKLGAIPKIVTSSFLAYWAGKISYILSDSCKDKFLKNAPDSETAYYIRKERDLPQPWTATREFGNIEDNKNDDSKYEDFFSFNIPSFLSVIYGGSSDDIDDIVMRLSEKESEVLNECENRGRLFCSLPLSLICGTSMYILKKKKIIKELRETNIKLIKKLPHFPFRNRTLHGIIFGYILGQLLVPYVMSSDCEERFLKYAPDGDVARRIREEREGIENVDDAQIDKENISNTEHLPENINKQDILDIDPDTHSTYLADYSDIKSIDWFGKCDIELPEKFKRDK